MKYFLYLRSLGFAAQLAIALGYFQHGILGATAVGIAFVVPSFLMVVALSIAYLKFGGLWWMQALFYGIGAASSASSRSPPTSWRGRRTRRIRCCGSSSPRLALVTFVAEAELAEFFILAGVLIRESVSDMNGVRPGAGWARARGA